MTPHVMCQRCEAIFAADATLVDSVRCPACGYQGAPKRVMRASGPPSLEVFTRNWQKATGKKSAS